MNRRGFLSALAGAVAAAAYDPERALWVPGRKKIFIPPAPPLSTIRRVLITKLTLSAITFEEGTRPMRRTFEFESRSDFSLSAGETVSIHNWPPHGVEQAVITSIDHRMEWEDS